MTNTLNTSFCDNFYSKSKWDLCIYMFTIDVSSDGDPPPDGGAFPSP